MPQLSKQTHTSLSDINMVPFIDVVLVLLIIFMITAPILQSGIEVDVPKTRTVKEMNQERLVVTVDKAQRIYLGNEPINIHQRTILAIAHLSLDSELKGFDVRTHATRQLARLGEFNRLESMEELE